LAQGLSVFNPFHALSPAQSIAEIERLERIFAVPDTRPLSASDPLGCESAA
jgi:hypothetical protein